MPQSENEAYYIKEYINQLDKKDLKTILLDIFKKAQEENKTDISLLCYEAPNDFCHRHILADYLEKKPTILKEIEQELNIEIDSGIKEVGFPYADFSKEYKLSTTLEKDPSKHYLSITGHADLESAMGDEKGINGYNPKTYQKAKKDIEDFLEIYMKKNNINKITDIVFISGMARGIDEIFVDIAEEKNCDVVLSIPNSVLWHQNRPARQNGTRGQAYDYQKHLDYATNRKNSYIFEVRKKYNGKTYQYANFARNDLMNRFSDFVVSYKNGKSPGTEHAIGLAKENGNYLGNILDILQKEKEIKKDTCFNIDYNQDLFEKKSSVIIQGCNCFNTMGAGIAAILKQKFPMVYEVDLKTIKGDRKKLGDFTYARVDSIPNSNTIYVVNLYSQYTFNNKNDMFNIEAFNMGMKKIIEHFIKERNDKNKKDISINFSFPAIGLGLANGKIEEIYKPKDKKLNKDFKKLETNDNLIKVNYPHL